MRLVLLGAILVICLTGCSGGGSSDTSNLPAPLTPQSPGGIWFGFDSGSETVSFYIAETGVLRAVLNPAGGLFPSFGHGNVSVTSSNAVSGSFELRGYALPPTFQQVEDLGCLLTGTVSERQALTANIICSDSAGVVYDETLTLNYDRNFYERGSSLEAMAGDYTLAFLPDSNSLNIASDGTLFGMLHNGARCTVNGTAAIIDPDYSLIGVSWTMSDCTDLIGIYEGVQMSGFALSNAAPLGNPDSYYFLMTGQTQNGMFSISVMYDPV